MNLKYSYLKIQRFNNPNPVYKLETFPLPGQHEVEDSSDRHHCRRHVQRSDEPGTAIRLAVNMIGDTDSLLTCTKTWAG